MGRCRQALQLLIHYHHLVTDMVGLEESEEVEEAEEVGVFTMIIGQKAAVALQTRHGAVGHSHQLHPLRKLLKFQHLAQRHLSSVLPK